MKTPNPDTICGAIGVVKAAISIELAATTIGKSTNLVHKFINADATPNIHQCVALDIAYERETGLPGPIMRAARLKIAAAQAPASEAHCLNENIVDLADELGAFSRTIRDAWSDRRISPLEQAELKSGLYRMEMAAQATRQNIDAHCNPAEPVLAESGAQAELAYH